MRVAEDQARWRAIGEAMSSSGLWYADDDFTDSCAKCIRLRDVDSQYDELLDDICGGSANLRAISTVARINEYLRYYLCWVPMMGT
jgi:hypothetical protein